MGKPGLTAQLGATEEAKFTGYRMMPPSKSHPEQVLANPGLPVSGRVVETANPTPGKEKERECNRD